MAHFACICVPLPGHINPMVALARELVARGHSATFLQVVDMEPMVRRPGLTFVPIGKSTHPAGSLEQMTRDAGRVTGFLGLRRLIRHLARMTALLCEELPQALRGLSVDMILTDQLEAAGGMVGYHMGIPFISVAAALPLNWDHSVPSPFVGWPYGEGRWHHFRNGASAYGAMRAMDPIGDVIESVAQTWGLRQGRMVEDYMSGFAQISQLPSSLDFPRRALSGCFHYCGPLREKADSSPFELRDQTRRAFASLGSLQGHRAGLFDQISRAAVSCGFNVTIAHGGRLAAREIQRLSQRAAVHDFVAQDEVLGRSDLAILHGGLNTVLDALAKGVPMILVPLAYEQGAIAARVVRSGAGLVYRPHGFRTRRLTSLIREVRDMPSFAEAAAKQRDAILKAGGVKRAADIVEQVLATGRPVFNSGAPDYGPMPSP